MVFFFAFIHLQFLSLDNHNNLLHDLQIIFFSLSDSLRSQINDILAPSHVLCSSVFDALRANAQQPKLFVGMILILIFAEALALYGLIVGIILSSRAGQSRAD